MSQEDTFLPWVSKEMAFCGQRMKCCYGDEWLKDTLLWMLKDSMESEDSVQMFRPHNVCLYDHCVFLLIINCNNTALNTDRKIAVNS